MQEKNKKNDDENIILAWYNEIPRKKRSKFMATLQLKLEMSQNTIYNKMRTNTWRAIDREVIEQIINDGSWENDSQMQQQTASSHPQRFRGCQRCR